MAQWTHNICGRCWIIREPVTEPVTLRDATEENCCFCGSLNADGIYVREDPNSTLLTFCKGTCRP